MHIGKINRLTSDELLSNDRRVHFNLERLPLRNVL